MRVIFLPEAEDFLDRLEEGARDKVIRNAKIVESGVKDDRLFKKLDDDIWELRTSYSRMEYRLLSFWDTREETLVVATHGIVKKTQKMPSKEIKKAAKIRNEYFNS